MDKNVVIHSFLYTIKKKYGIFNVEERYEKIYKLVENYIKLVLPYKEDLECKDRVVDVYKNLV